MIALNMLGDWKPRHSPPQTVNETIQLSRPPLREALISIQLAEELSEQFVDSLKGEKLDDFEIVRPTKKGQFTIQMHPEKPAQASVTRDEVDGWRYESKDGSIVVQLRRSGMTYSILRGYTTWERIKESASQAWHQYCEKAGNPTVGTLAVRYINVLQLPLGSDFDEYLTAGPRIPSKAPQFLNGFFHRVEIPFPSSGAVAIVTQALEPPTETGMPVVLDIDVQRKSSYKGDSAEIWYHLDELRSIKNLIFFSSLTDRALELCK